MMRDSRIFNKQGKHQTRQTVGCLALAMLMLKPWQAFRLWKVPGSLEGLIA